MTEQERPELVEQPINGFAEAADIPEPISGKTAGEQVPEPGVPGIAPGPVRHRHIEAFRLMLYSSPDGAIIETIWNSRDGVTPYIVSAKDGVTELRHVLWGGDPYAPHHVPNLGDRVFVDLSLRDADELARQAVEHYWNDPHVPWSAQLESKEKAIERVRAEMCRPGAPAIVSVNEALQRTYVEKRSELTQKLQRRILDQRQGIPAPGGAIPPTGTPQPPASGVGSG